MGTFSSFSKSKVNLIFWGKQWQAGDFRSSSEIITALRNMINSHYFDGLKQYGFHQIELGKVLYNTDVETGPVTYSLHERGNMIEGLVQTYIDSGYLPDEDSEGDSRNVNLVLLPENIALEGALGSTKPFTVWNFWEMDTHIAAAVTSNLQVYQKTYTTANSIGQNLPVLRLLDCITIVMSHEIVGSIAHPHVEMVDGINLKFGGLINNVYVQAYFSIQHNTVVIPIAKDAYVFPYSEYQVNTPGAILTPTVENPKQTGTFYVDNIHLSLCDQDTSNVPFEWELKNFDTSIYFRINNKYLLREDGNPEDFKIEWRINGTSVFFDNTYPSDGGPTKGVKQSVVINTNSSFYELHPNQKPILKREQKTIQLECDGVSNVKESFIIRNASLLYIEIPKTAGNFKLTIECIVKNAIHNNQIRSCIVEIKNQVYKDNVSEYFEKCLTSRIAVEIPQLELEPQTPVSDGPGMVPTLTEILPESVRIIKQLQETNLLTNSVAGALKQSLLKNYFNKHQIDDSLFFSTDRS